MKLLICVMLSGLFLGAGFVDRAEAGNGRKGSKHARYDRRDTRYFAPRDVYVIRESYRPYYRPLPPGLRHNYYRTGRLPPGWAKRMRPVPVYVERDLIAVPRGYRRGIIDGRAVVYNPGGFIIDVAVLF